MDKFSIIYLVVLFVVFYFFLIRPQQQRAKKHQELMGSIKVNDNVVTIGGIYGTVTKIMDKSVILKIDENVKVEMLKSSIAYKNEKGGSADSAEGGK